MATRSRPTIVAAAGLGVVFVFSLGLALLLFERLYADRIYPGVTVSGNLATADLGGRTREDAAQLLSDQYERYLRTPVLLQYLGREWSASPRDLGARLDTDTTIGDAFAVGRDATLLTRLRAQTNTLRGGVSLPPPSVTFDDAKLTAYLTQLARDLEKPTAAAAIALRGDGSVIILPSQAGAKLNLPRTAEQIRSDLSTFSSAPIVLRVDDVAPSLGETDLVELKRQAEKMLAQPLVVQATVDGTTKSWTLDAAGIADLVEIRRTNTIPPSYELAIQDEKIRRWVETIAPEIERAPRNARFAPGAGALKVVRDGEDGRRIELMDSIDRIHNALATGERLVTLRWQAIRPQFSAADIGKLQFPDLVERASTAYGGTLPERMFNVELATARINGVVIGPGESFSFNYEVGGVSYRSGYKKAYGVSQDGDDIVTIPSEGGGICQVATTVFQAVFWAGYPVVERNWHLYWIPRYGARPKGLKGLDATIDQVYDKENHLVYAVDLRWRNNTEAPILLIANADGKNVTVSLWGRKPDWQVKVAEPKIDKIVRADTRQVKQPDPTIAVGTELMVEHAEDGFEAAIVRTILRDSKIIDETRFVSTYRPSRNVFLVGVPPSRAGSAANARIEDHPATPLPASGTPGSVITPLPSPEPPRTPTASSRTPTSSPTPRVPTPRPTRTPAS